jgi:hypothetical protein
MYAFVINCINALIRGMGKVLEIALALLPESPFRKYLIENDTIREFVGYINFFVPVAQILIVLEMWCSAIALFYVVQIVLRWCKAIE